MTPLRLNINIAHVIYISIFENTNTIEELEYSRAHKQFRIHAFGKKTAYISWKPPFLYPQTGPWFGHLGITESGLPLDKNTNIGRDKETNKEQIEPVK